MKKKIFISHGWADRWVAQQIEAKISACKCETFIDVYDIEKGDDFEERIFEELENCDELVVLFTPWSVSRNWIWVEIGAARANKLRIVAILYNVSLDSIEQESGGTTFLRAKNAVDINEIDAYFDELRARIGK